MYAVMVRPGMASAHFYPEPCSCRLVGLVMVFWLQWCVGKSSGDLYQLGDNFGVR